MKLTWKDSVDWTAIRNSEEIILYQSHYDQRWVILQGNPDKGSQVGWYHYPKNWFNEINSHGLPLSTALLLYDLIKAGKFDIKSNDNLIERSTQQARETLFYFLEKPF